MGKTEQQLPTLLNNLRWIVPTLIAVLSVGYILFENLLIASSPIDLTHTLREAIIIGTLGFTLTWLLLTWITRIAQSRQQVIESLEWRVLQLETASQVSQKIVAILEVDELLPQVVKLVQDKFGYYHVHLFLVNKHSNEIVLRECSGQADESLKAQGLCYKIGDRSITSWVAQTGQPVLCNDVSQDSRYRVHELLPETQAELTVPLKIGDVVVGILDVQSEHCNAFGEDDMTALQILGGQIAVAIENARLFREVQHQVEVMRALHAISLDITSQLDSKQVLDTILEEATCLLNAQGSSLSVYDSQKDLIRRIAVYNLPSKYKGITLRVGEGTAGQVVATGKPLIVNNYQQWAGRSPNFQDSPYDAIISVPLHWEDQVFGTLCALDHSKHRSFTEEDVQLLSLFADLASIGLKSAELYAQVVQLNQHLEQKVEQRTSELVRVREEVAHKAEQLQQLLAATVRIQEEERSRIARDLHDGSNQLITGTLYEIQAAQESVKGQRWEVALEKLQTAKGLLREIEAENRCIIFGLRPPILDTQGLVPALKWQVDTHQKHYGTTCAFQVFGHPTQLPPEAEATVYRIVQESLNNVATHSQAQSVQMRIDFGSARLCIVIRDDGVGFDSKRVLTEAPGQMGLVGMKERAQSIGGQLEVRSSLGHGAQIELDVPLPTQSNQSMDLSAKEGK